MKVRTFIISAIIVWIVLTLFWIIAIRNDRRMQSENLKRDSIYAIVDSLSRQCHNMDSIINVQNNKIKSIEKRLNINDKKISNNNRIANNAIKGLALKYALDYYGY